MKNVVMLVGLPGSGKSTWAKKYIMEHPTNIIVSRDAIRESLIPEHRKIWYGRSDKDDLENLVTSIETISADIALSKDYDVILDSTHLTTKSQMRWKKCFERYKNVNFKIKFFSVALETCIERDLNREFPVGEKVITDMYNKFTQIRNEDSFEL